MAVNLVRSAWAGTSGGPGLTQTAFDRIDFGPISAADAQVAVNAVRAYWDAIKAYLPNEVVITVSTVVDGYDVVTGELETSVIAPAAPASVQGTDAGAYAMAAGMRVGLMTGVIRNGRRVRGAMYVVPAGAGAYGVTGAVSSTVRTAVNAAGNTLRTTIEASGMRLLVWSRPLPVGVPNGPRSGDVAQVTGIETNEKAAILRGRRD